MLLFIIELETDADCLDEIRMKLKQINEIHDMDIQKQLNCNEDTIYRIDSGKLEITKNMEKNKHES